MARFAQAKWRGPVPNVNKGEMLFPVHGLVPYIQQGTEAGVQAAEQIAQAAKSASG